MITTMFPITVNRLNRRVIERKLETISQMSAGQCSRRVQKAWWSVESQDNKVRLQNITARKGSMLSSIQELPENSNFL